MLPALQRRKLLKGLSGEVPEIMEDLEINRAERSLQNLLFRYATSTRTGDFMIHCQLSFTLRS